MTKRLTRKYLVKNDRFIVTGHSSPDADCLGACAAVLAALRQMGKQAKVIISDPPEERYRFIDPGKNFEIFNRQTHVGRSFSGWRLLILDTGDSGNIGGLANEILPWVKSVTCVDHHNNVDNLTAPSFVDDKASSTCEIVYDLLKKLNVKIDLHIATALYAGLVYDTGSFIFSKTTAKTFSTAGKLIKIGVNPTQVYSRIFENQPLATLSLRALILESLEFFEDKQVAVQFLTTAMLEKSQASYADADQSVNLPLQCSRIKISIFIKEHPDGFRRCSLRSKGAVNVCRVAREFGGGGHINASGFKSPDSATDIKDRLLPFLRAALEEKSQNGP